MNDISVTLSADDRLLLQTLREAGVDIQQFARKGAGALRELEESSRTSATGIEKMAGGMKTAFVGGSVAAAIITIKNAIGDVTVAMIDAQMQADKVKNSLTFAMGGPQAAQEIDYLRQVTDKLGVSFAAVAPMYGRLAAATKGTNLEGRATREIFESIAQASVVMGLGVEETEGAMRALVQMVSKGQIQAEELRGQLGERLPRAFQIFAESMGKSTGELSKLLEAGQVGPERLAQFAATLKGELAGGLDEATTRLAANVNRLDNAWLQLKQNVGEAGVSSFMAGQMAILADATGDVAKSMEAARKGGDGFLGQMAAAGGALLRFANPFNAITYNVQDQATELKIAQDQLREFEALLGKEPNNVFLIRGIAQLKETVAWLQAANSEKDKFAGSGPSHRTMENNSMKALAEQQAKDAKELADIKAKLMGVDKDYLPTLTKLNDAYRAGNLTQKEYVGLVGELAKKNYTAAKSTAAHADAFGDFVKKLNEKLAAQALELDAGRKLSDSEKLRIQFNEELGTKYSKLTAADLARVEALLKAIAAGEEQVRTTRRMVAAFQAELEVQAELDAAYVAESKAREQGRLAVDAYVQSIAESSNQVRLEQSLFGQSSRNRSIALEQYQIELDLKKQIAAINANAGFDQAQRDEEIARATAAAAIAKASAVAKADMAALQSLFDAFDNTAHDVFVNIFNDGSNAFKKLGQSLKAGLIDVLYQLTLKRWIISIGASVSGVGGSTLANAAGSGSNLLSGASTLAGLAGGFNTASTLGAFGSGFVGSAASTLGFAEAGSTLAASSAASTAAGFGGASSAGAALGAVAPYLAAATAIYYIAKNLDHSGTPHIGAGTSYSAASGLAQASAGATGGGLFSGITYSDSTQQMTTSLVQSIVGILDTTAVAFGKSAGYQAAASFADDSSKDGAWGSLVISKLGEVVSGWAVWAGHGQVFSDGAAGSAEYLAKVTADVRTALDQIGLPGWATSMLDKLGASPTLDQLAATVAEINKTEIALVSMGKVLVGFSGMSDGAVSALIKTVGGIDALSAAAATYYDAFYSDGEKSANTLKGITAALGTVNQTVPTTREAYRAQVEYLQSIADTEPAAAPALAVMLQMAGAFASVVPPAQAAADAVVDTVEEVATLGQELDALRNPIRSIKDIAQGIFKLEREGADLQVELLKTYGDEASLRAAAILQRDIETAGMTEQELALYDLNAMRRAEITAINAQRQAIADGVASWEAYFDLFGTDAEKQGRAKTRVQAVLPEWVDTVEEYRGYVYLLTEEFGVGSAEVKKATDVARDFAIAIGRTADDIANSIRSLQSTGSSLTMELLRAQGKDGEADAMQRDIDTAGMTEAEVALYDFNAGMRALIEATKAATEAARAEAAQKTGLENTLLQALGETATLRQRELESFPLANRALQEMIWTVTDAQSAIAGLNADIARLDQVASQASQLSNSLSVMLGGPDNTESLLWATVNSASATAEEKLTAISSLMGIINNSITADTQAETARLQAQTTAAEELARTQAEAAKTQLDNAQKLVELGRTLADYVTGLQTGNLSALTPGERLAVAQADYERTLRAAQAGDATAAGKLQGVSSTYLEQARGYDPGAYSAVFGNVTGSLTGLSGSMMSAGERAAAAAQQQVSLLGTLTGTASAQNVAVNAGNVISESNRMALESLLGLVTTIQADAVIEKAAKQAQLTAENDRMNSIRDSLKDSGVIATGISSMAGVMTAFAEQQKLDNAALVTEISTLREEVITLRAATLGGSQAVAAAVMQSGADSAATVAGAVATAIDEAAGAPAVT